VREGNLVVLTKRAAEAALPSLLGYGHWTILLRSTGTMYGLQGEVDRRRLWVARTWSWADICLREIFLRSWRDCEIGKQRPVGGASSPAGKDSAESKTFMG